MDRADTTSTPGNWPPRVFTNLHQQSWSPAWLGTDKTLYQPGNWRPSDQIPVAGLRQIYIWPLTAVFGGDAGKTANDIQMLADDLGKAGSSWAEIEDLLDHLNPPMPACEKTAATAPGAAEPDPADDASRQKKRQWALEDRAQRYGEFVYFHDFVQKILFRRHAATGQKPPIRLFRHKIISAVEVGLDCYDAAAGRAVNRIFRGEVCRANLYMIDSGAAALVVEINFATCALTLAQAQVFIQQARCSYTPWFATWNDPPTPANVPKVWRWLDANGEDFAEPSHPASFEEDLGHIKSHRAPAIAAHWLALLAPLKIADAEGATGWRHIADERIPLMSFISLTGAASKYATGVPVRTGQVGEWGAKDLAAQMDLSLVSRGDWARLCYADGPGTDPLPYAPAIFRNFEENACYDRYFPGDATSTSIRYLFAGYHFAAVGAGNFFDETLVHHFRRHYFQIGLVVTMELAMMLALSGRVSDAVRQHRGRAAPGPKAADAFRRTMLGIQQSFLELTHLYVFRGLSNQMQPTEMYEKWRKTLNLDAIFDDLKNEIDSATSFLATQRQGEQADAANRLAAIAAGGVFLGLWLALSQMLFGAIQAFPPIGPWLMGAESKATAALALIWAVAVILLALAITAWVAYAILAQWSKWEAVQSAETGQRNTSRSATFLKSLIWRIAVGASLFCVAFLIAGATGRICKL